MSELLLPACCPSADDEIAQIKHFGSISTPFSNVYEILTYENIAMDATSPYHVATFSSISKDTCTAYLANVRIRLQLLRYF